MILRIMAKLKRAIVRVLRILILAFMKVFWERKETGTAQIETSKDVSFQVNNNKSNMIYYKRLENTNIVGQASRQIGSLRAFESRVGIYSLGPIS